MAKLQDIDRDRIVFLSQHAGNGKTVTTIISFAAKDAVLNIVVDISFQPFHAFTCGSFHQINGGDRLMLYSILIPEADILGAENFHPPKILLIREWAILKFWSLLS